MTVTVMPWIGKRITTRSFIAPFPLPGLRSSPLSGILYAGEEVIACRLSDTRKVRTPKSGTLGNAQEGKPYGKCHRKDTARLGG
jgi:hypothetical protein